MRLGFRSKPLLRSGNPDSKVKAEHEKITKRGYVCAANNYRQKKAACSEPKEWKSCLINKHQ